MSAPASVLLADIGGTNARFALLNGDRLSQIITLPVADYPDISAALRVFLATLPDDAPPQSAILAVAGVIEPGHCRLTNQNWLIDSARLIADFALSNVQLVNDFMAIAWAQPSLMAADTISIGGGEALPDAPVLVVGPGTGLGLAYLVPGVAGPQVIATQGGHVTMPATNAREEAVLAFLRARWGHVSGERVLSGMGLENLYQALCHLDGADPSPRTAPQITQAALAGACPICGEALEMFCAMLGTLAGDAALTLGARGGVYIAGGIVPRIIDTLARSQFRARFEAKGRFQSYLDAIPTRVVMHPNPAFIGLRALAHQME